MPVTTPTEYMAQLPAERQPVISSIRATILQSLPPGFEECISYGMLGYVVPKSIYPAGYHCDPRLPLPFLSLASQKSHVALYHMGLYADPNLMAWFEAEWPLYSSKKPDLGKSCIRFKKPEEVPLDFIAALCAKMDPQQWIALYESVVKP